VVNLLKQEWKVTPLGDPRGYINPKQLKELWFHTGTICNLSCPFCLEGSKPGDTRLNKITLQDVMPLMQEAVTMGVDKFSFTGGEPFVIKDFISILKYALDLKPCHVLTNGTDPLLKSMDRLDFLKEKKHDLSFRISIDFPDQEAHEKDRGAGSFKKALEAIKLLILKGFSVSVARHMKNEEDKSKVENQYRDLFRKESILETINIVAFPDFYTPGSMVDVPHITENCMTTYLDEQARNDMMCNFSKMVIKKDGKMRVYACTLVDDDEDYDLGGTLKESMDKTIRLKHHRCYSCFAYGASCSE